MARFRGSSLIVAAVASVGLAVPAAAQGGWRQWDVYLRDGTRLEANPLGAPNDRHLSLSVAGFEGREPAIPRSRVDYLAAPTTVGPTREPLAGPPPPPAPTGRTCTDLVVRRDGRTTVGRVRLTAVSFSEGRITQAGADIDLQDVAYIKFAREHRNGCRRPKSSC